MPDIESIPGRNKPPARRRMAVALGALVLGVALGYVWYGSGDKLAGSIAALLLLVGAWEMFRPIKNDR